MADNLCESCRYVREVRTPQSRFLLCELSVADPEYPKYPRQPVVWCPSYRPADEGEKPGGGDRAGGRV